MNRIIIIGNGFDLAHGLKTGYKDFIEDLCRNILEEIRKSGETWKYEKGNLITLKMQYKSDDTNGFEDRESETLKIVLDKANSNYGETVNRVRRNFEPLEPNDKDISQKIKTSTGNLSVYLDYLEKVPEYPSKWKDEIKNKLHLSIGGFFRRLLESLNLQNWVDIEQEYHTALNKCSDDNERNTLNKELESIKTALYEYIDKQEEQIAAISEIKDKMFNDVKGNVLLLSFNYTSTEKYYIRENVQKIHIHGEIKNNNNPIIFGCDKHNISDTESNEGLNNIKKYLYNNVDNYKNLNEFLNKGEFEVFIMGHSCGESDRYILSKIFNHKNLGNHNSIRIFYRDAIDYNNKVKNIDRFLENRDLNDLLIIYNNCEPLNK
ncbi:MAG: bacteriophage abortive infection AbiH family protein [Chitinivibrionia bacterium]|nr:bacteriophage abortive infection AbiH family protein [Chitinivibrionia bacterium]